jgi:enoyl-CoA hydratase/carnithine racemase
MGALGTGTDQLLASVEDGVGRLVFDNRDRHNAITLAMQRAVPTTLAAFDDDTTVHVVVVAGAGDRSFVSGADITEFHASRATDAARAEYDATLAAYWSAWDTFEKPIVAMIRGHCIGGGLLTALKADMRIAAVGSEFGVAAARLGAGLATWGVDAVLAAVGPSWASEMLFSARRLSAEEAVAIGLVNRVAPGDQLERTTAALTAAIVANADGTWPRSGRLETRGVGRLGHRDRL